MLRLSIPGIDRVLLSMILATVGLAAANDDDKSSKPERVVQAMVTDREDRPIEGAQVSRLHWFGQDQSDEPQILTNARGEFDFAVEGDSRDRVLANYVVIYKEGYALGALNLDTLPARARLWPKKPVALRIVDAQQRAVAGARVALEEVGFDDEFLHANVPPSLDQATGTISRDDGWAILRSTRPEFLHSVRVDAEGYGSQSFACRFSVSKFKVLQLWETSLATLKVLDGEAAAAGWTVMATSNDWMAQSAGNEDWADKNPLNGNLLPTGISFTGTTDQDGRVRMEHALVRRRVNLLLFDTSKTWRGSGSVVALEHAQPDATLTASPSREQEGQEYTCRVLQSGSGEPVTDVKVTFQQHQQFPPQAASATSGKNGRLAVKLTPGQWHVSIEMAPPGYCSTLTSEQEILIEEDGGHQLADLYVPKGKVIQGKIQGVDLAIRRARWIHVSWADDEGESGRLHGRFQPDGSFAVTIPESATADIFEIVAVGGGNDVLVIKSRDPLVLTSSAEN